MATPNRDVAPNKELQPKSQRLRVGQVAVFNRSHYEDVLVVRVHNLVPKKVWSERFALINDFEKLLADRGTTIIKFFLYISPEEQLERFRQRLDDRRNYSR